jgi:hypothetical protein
MVHQCLWNMQDTVWLAVTLRRIHRSHFYLAFRIGWKHRLYDISCGVSRFHEMQDTVWLQGTPRRIPSLAISIWHFVILKHVSTVR